MFGDSTNDIPMFEFAPNRIAMGVHAVLEDLEQDYKGKMPFYEVDVEEESALFEKMMMKGVPPGRDLRQRRAGRKAGRQPRGGRLHRRDREVHLSFI